MAGETSSLVLRARLMGPVPQTQALLARFTTQPSAARAALINNMITTLLSAGTWQKLDVLYVMAAADVQSAQQNWIQNLYNLTPNNNPVFTADRGYTGDGSTSFLDTGLNPSTAPGLQMQQNTVGIGVWSLTDALNIGYDFGNGGLKINSRSTNGSTLRGQLNDVTATNYGALTTSLGLSALLRSSSTAVAGYRNGSLVATSSVTSIAPISTNMRVLADNSGNFSPRQLAIAFAGGLNASDMSVLYSAALAYLTAIGAAFQTSQALRIAATLGRISGANTPGGNDGTNTQHLSRNVHRTGKNAVSAARMVAGNVQLTGAAPYGELGVGNQITYRGNFEYPTGSVNTTTRWGGAISGTANDLSTLASDGTLDIPANTAFYSRLWSTVADTTKKWPRAQSVGTNGQKGEKSTDESTAFAATGALSGTNDAAHPPLAILGYVDRSTVSVAYYGTSIEDGTGDITSISTDGAVSYIGRGLESVNGFNIPSCKMSRGSEIMKAAADSTSGAIRRSMLQYATHVINMSPTNDILAGDGLGALQNYCRTIWGYARAAGCKVYQVNCIPRTDDPVNNNWSSASTQVPKTGFAAGSTRDQFNAWIQTQVGGLLDGVIDFNSVCADPVKTDWWRTDLGTGNNTVDGTHPQSGIHTLGAAIVNALAATWTAS